LVCDLWRDNNLAGRSDRAVKFYCLHILIIAFPGFNNTAPWSISLSIAHPKNSAILRLNVMFRAPANDGGTRSGRSIHR